MGKFKPFLFGAILGAGLAICALQFHVVHSHEGVRIVARTPQPSLGLAYVDIRGWDVDKFADRPELVRALVANGSSDLVAGAVTEDVMGSITSDDETLNKLRSFINDSEAPAFGADDTDSGMISIPRDINDDSDDEFDDLFSTSFPQDARRNNGRQASAGADAQKREASPRVARRHEIPSIDDVMSSGPDFDEIRKPSATDSRRTSPSGQTDDGNTDLLEEMLFGDESSASGTAGETEPDAFDDITSTLESRADAALERARQGFREESGRAAQDVYDSASRYTRDTVRDAADKSGLGPATDYLTGSGNGTDSGSSAWSRNNGSSTMPDFDSAETFSEDIDDDLPAALKAVRDGLDPFID